MRRALVLTGLMVVVFLAAYGAPAEVAAAQYCSVSCPSGSLLECNTSGTCSSASGLLTCCGQTYNCAAIDAWNACQNKCFDAYDACVDRCVVRDPCLTDCRNGFSLCRSRCGPRPQISFTC